jgi:uncharacterized protein (TIGR03382 family)
MKRCGVFTTLMCIALSGLWADSAAYAITLQPSESTGQDGFGYQFLPTTNVHFPSFSNWLPVGATTTGHDTQSVLKFDLSSVGLTGAQVASASIQLFAISTESTNFGVSPSAGQPITVDMYAATSSWDESTVTWATLPTLGSLVDSEVVNAINQTYTFDVTDLVKQWLDSPVSNNGVRMLAPTAVGASPSWVYAVFNSSNGSPAPALVINPVPEPSTSMLAAVAAPALAWVGMRRRQRSA